jgi:hypothetical protein
MPLAEARRVEQGDFVVCPMVPFPMYNDDLFHSPVDRIAAFAQAQLHLVLSAGTTL